MLCTQLAHHEPGRVKHHLPYNFLDAAGDGAKTLSSDRLDAALPEPVGQLSNRAFNLTECQVGLRAGLGVGVVVPEHTAAKRTDSRPKAAGVPVMAQADALVAEGGWAMVEGGSAIAEGDWALVEDGCAIAEGGHSTAQHFCTKAASEQAQPGPAAPRDSNNPRDGKSQGAALLGDHAMPEHVGLTSPVNDHPAAKATTAGNDPAAAQTHSESTEPPGTSFFSTQRCMPTAEFDGDSPAQAPNSALQQLARDQRPEIAAAADNIRAAAPAATAQSDAAASQPAAATAAGSLAITQLICTTAQCRATTAVVADTIPAYLDAALANADSTAAPPPATADEALPTAASTPSLHVTDAAEKEGDGRLDKAVPEAHLQASVTIAQDLSMTDLQLQDDSSSEAQGE